VDSHHQAHRFGVAILAALALLSGCSSSRAKGPATTATQTTSSPSVSTVPITTTPITTGVVTTAAPVTSTTLTAAPATTAQTDAPTTDPSDLSTIDWVPIVQRLQDRLRDLYANPTAEGVAGYCVPKSPCDTTTGEALRGSQTDGEHATNVPPFTVARVQYVPSTQPPQDPSLSKPALVAQLRVTYIPSPASKGEWVRNGVAVKTVDYPAEDGQTAHPLVMFNFGPAGDEWRVWEWTGAS
jgi:hypothetical protein